MALPYCPHDQFEAKVLIQKQGTPKRSKVHCCDFMAISHKTPVTQGVSNVHKNQEIHLNAQLSTDGHVQSN